MKTIELVYFNAGGGHRAAAQALEAVIREQGRPWQVRLHNLVDLLDPQEIFRKTTGTNPEDFYNGRLARGWTLGLAQELKVLQALIRLGHEKMVRQLQKHWRVGRPDLVVSLIPNFNRAMSRACATLHLPFVTIMTDFADYPPHFWLEPHPGQHVICGTPTAAEQARVAGFSDSSIHQTSGMIIRPEFYRDLRLDRAAERHKLDLDPARPTGIVMFGGHGSKAMVTIARELDDTQLILICGHNAALARRLRKLPARAPRLIVEFTQEIPYYMALSDFFVGKPGPGSISEAVQQRLPVIVVRNAWTMPQERYNPQWVLDNGAGLVLKSFEAIRTGVAAMTRNLEQFRTHVGRLQNRAVFEIPVLLGRIMDERPYRHGTPRAMVLPSSPVPLQLGQRVMAHFFQQRHVGLDQG